MFRWHRDAAKCYVYLSDVSTGKHSQSSELLWEPAFRQSRWFTRGWTLQELLAPRSVEFFSRDAKRLGDKNSLEQQIHDITGIAVHVLQGGPLSQISENERRSWAAKRETTIEEDQVYCLLGIFYVYLSPIYGEGKKNTLRRLQEEITKLSSVNIQVKLSQEKHKCLQALRTSNYEQFKDRNPDRLEGTCQWLLQHEHFTNWQQSKSSSLLCVSADPGCGKSVLAKFLADQEIKSTKSRIVCSFFFMDDNDKQKDVATALSALLHQLFSQKSLLIQHAVQDFAAEGEKLSQLFHKLWTILTKASSDPNASEIICIPDALDECEESGRHQIINALNTFHQRAPLSGHGVTQLKFLITSRPYFDIEREFVDLTDRFPLLRLQGENESAIICQEIGIVIKATVSELARKRRLDDSERLTLEKALLGSDVQCTYLWFKLVVEVISKTLSLTTKTVKKIVSTLLKTVDEAYEAILSKIKPEDQERALKLLHVIVAATRPLTLKEMNIALAIEDHSRTHDDLELENEARFEQTVRNPCGLFATVHQKIYLLHQTTKEFLVVKSQVAANGWKHSLESHTSL